MKTKLIVLLIVLLVVSLSTAYAGNSLRSGTAGALELKIPYGSRGTAMGGSILSSVSGVESMYWNPAGLASLEGSEVMFTHLPYIADIEMNYVGFATTIEGFGTLGAGAKILAIGDMIETTELEPDGTGRVFSPTLSVINLSYAKILTANVQFGMSAMFINEHIFEVQANGVAFDFGFTYNPRWNGLSMGVTIKNYGGEMQFSGIGFNQTQNQVTLSGIGQKFDLPSSINFGIGYDFVDEGPNFASLNGAFQSNNYSEDIYFGGAEYVYDGKYSLRAGYNYSDQDPNNDGTNDYIYGASFGAGVMIPLGDMDLSLEYTWTQTDIFDNNQYFTLKANF